jgi:hypothetical protein
MINDIKWQAQDVPAGPGSRPHRINLARRLNVAPPRKRKTRSARITFTRLAQSVLGEKFDSHNGIFYAVLAEK